MAVYIHHYIHKSSNNTFNGRQEMNASQQLAYTNWNEYCVQVQPGWVSTDGPIDIDENTRKITYTIDMQSYDFINPHVTDFWKNTHDENNQYYAAYKAAFSGRLNHKFRVTIEKDGVETDFIPLPA
jgi:hypothetical protein